MARQRIHNRRAARGSVGGGASWISYSDMMAALLLIFVLILTYSLSHYFTMLEDKESILNQNIEDLAAKDLLLDQTRIDLAAKDLLLRQNMHELGHTNRELNETRENLKIIQQQLSEREEDLRLSQEELNAARETLEAQQQLLAEQADRLDDIVGVRRTMISDLSATLSRAGIDAVVDDSGNIVLNGNVFFETNSFAIRPEGQKLLNDFIPVYLSVLLRDEYSDYLGEIIIEGHTDSTGTYEKNLKLSQDRALQVALYCLQMPSLSDTQKDTLKKILTAKGRSSSDPVLVNGIEDMDASRRVEFKFSLIDAKMIEDMNQILSRQDAEDE